MMTQDQEKQEIEKLLARGFNLRQATIEVVGRSNGEEFVIRGSGHATEMPRSWTRDTIESAVRVADSAVRSGFTRAVVVNVFGGTESSVLYDVHEIE